MASFVTVDTLRVSIIQTATPCAYTNPSTRQIPAPDKTSPSKSHQLLLGRFFLLFIRDSTEFFAPLCCVNKRGEAATQNARHQRGFSWPVPMFSANAESARWIAVMKRKMLLRRAYCVCNSFGGLAGNLPIPTKGLCLAPSSLLSSLKLVIIRYKSFHTNRSLCFVMAKALLLLTSSTFSRVFFSAFFRRRRRQREAKFMKTACERALNSLSWSLRYDPIIWPLLDGRNSFRRRHFPSRIKVYEAPETEWTGRKSCFQRAVEAKGEKLKCCWHSGEGKADKKGIEGEVRWQCTNPLSSHFLL